MDLYNKNTNILLNFKLHASWKLKGCNKFEKKTINLEGIKITLMLFTHRIIHTDIGTFSIWIEQHCIRIYEFRFQNSPKLLIMCILEINKNKQENQGKPLH
jgi:hypothetical protein